MKWFWWIDDLFRLYYLYEDSMIKHMKEESFFMCLKWFHHSLTGIIASTMLVESRLDTNESHSLHIFYSFCSKKHILWEEFQGSSANKMFAVTQMTLMALTFISQIFLFIREKQLEKQRREGIMVVTYNMDGVTISVEFKEDFIHRRLVKRQISFGKNIGYRTTDGNRSWAPPSSRRPRSRPHPRPGTQRGNVQRYLFSSMRAE